MTRWTDLARTWAGEDYARAYADRFAAMAAAGEDINGEVALAASLVPSPARVLDAGCGTGRSSIAFDSLGYDVVGIDLDDAMLDVARADAPGLDWRQADLATFDLGERFDLVLLAGNIVPLLEPGTLPAVAERLAAHVESGAGRLVGGFGFDADHLPPGCPITPLEDYDAAMEAAGFVVDRRWSTWEKDPWDPAAGYVVTAHQLTPEGQE